jgi:ribosomal protein L28
MAIRCDLCGKGKIFGLQHRHHRGVAGGQWKKRAQKTAKLSLPNLHSYRGVIAGEKVVWRLCTKCLRLVKKENADIKQKESVRKIAADSIAKKDVKKAVASV